MSNTEVAETEPLRTGDQGDLIVEYGSQSHSLRLGVLLESLLGLGELITALNNEIYPDTQIHVNINATAYGSFRVHLGFDLHTIKETLVKLFTGESIKSIDSIITNLVTLINLKKHLKGKEPEEVKETPEGVAVTNSAGAIVNVNPTIYQFFNTPEAQQGLSRHVRPLTESPDVEDMKYLDQNERVLTEVKRAEFPDFVEAEYRAIEEHRIVTQRAVVELVMVSLRPDLKWRILFAGNSYHALLEDQEYWKRFNEGKEPTSPGDSLDVDLILSQEFESSLNGYVTREIRISKVHHHHRQFQQLPLSPESE